MFEEAGFTKDILSTAKASEEKKLNLNCAAVTASIESQVDIEALLVVPLLRGCETFGVNTIEIV